MGSQGRPLLATRATRGVGWDPPLAVIPGLVLMAVALGVDAAAHAGLFLSLEAPAHLLGVLGMVLTWIAVVGGGIRQSRPH